MKTKIYDQPLLLRNLPLSLERGVCTVSIINGGSSVNTTGQQVDNKDYDTDFSPVWK